MQRCTACGKTNQKQDCSHVITAQKDLQGKLLLKIITVTSIYLLTYCSIKPTII